MVSRALALALLLPGFAFGQQAEQVFPLPLFTEGLYTRYSSNIIPDGALSEALNVLIDEDVNGVVCSRRGYARYNATAITNTQSVRTLVPFDANDGTKYVMAMSSAAFYKSAGDGVFAAVTGLSGYSSTLDFNCTQGNGKFWCTNGTSVFSWDGTSTATVSGAPLGNLIGSFRNRVLISGISSQRSTVRGSGELDGTDWTVQVPGVSTTPFTIPIGGTNDGSAVTCLMGQYQDSFLIGKRDSIWAIYGFSRADFQTRKIDGEIGCLEPRSVQYKNNCMYWLSQRGVEKFCGTRIERVSDPIRDQVDTIIATAGNQRSNTDTTQSDFQAGNVGAAGPGAPMSTSISPGNVVPSSWTHVDTSSTDFAAGTIPSSLSTSAVADSVTFSTTSGFRIFNGDFQDGNNGNWTGVIDPSYSGINRTEFLSGSSCQGGSKCWYLEATCGDFLNGSPRYILTDYDTGEGLVNEGGVTQGSPMTVDVSAYRGRRMTVTIIHRGSSAAIADYALVRSSSFTAYSQLTFSVSANISQSCSIDTYTAVTVDNFTVDRYFSLYASSITPVAFQSQMFNTGFSTVTPGAFTATVSSPTGTGIAFQVRTASSTNGVWSAWTNITLNNQATALVKQYWQYQSTFTTSVGTAAPILQDVSLVAATTGYFIGQCRNPSTAITAWKEITCNQTANGGTFTLEVATGANCGAAISATTAPWTTQLNNAIISIATAPYVAYRVGFLMSVATQTPTLADCTISWSEGDTRPPVASSVYRDRYYLAYTSSTLSGATNDHVLVLDKNDKWSLFDDHSCYSMAVYNRSLYCGSSTAAGRVWKMDIGRDDDGAAIHSRISTKSFHLGMPDRRKSYQRIYFDLEPVPDSGYAINMTPTFRIDRGTTTYSLGTMSLSEDMGFILTSKANFPLTDKTDSRYIDFQLDVNQTAGPWKLFGGRLYYSPLSPE